MIDKRFADRMLHAFRHSHSYRHHFRGCPCCGSEDDCRKPAETRSLAFDGFVAPGDSSCLAAHYRCLACKADFYALFDGPVLVGFREIPAPPEGDR